MELDDKYFTAGWMNYMAMKKPDRDAAKEMEAIKKAIENEARNGKFTYSRGHLFPQNIDYLRKKGFKVTIISKKHYEISWA